MKIDREELIPIFKALESLLYDESYEELEDRLMKRIIYLEDKPLF